jgi:hypothetical protein
MKGKHSLMISLLSIFCAGTLSARELMVYRNEGQEAEKQEMDQFQCYGWAKE